MIMKTQQPKTYGFSESARREVHSNTRLPQETRETSNQQLNLTLKATRKRTTKKTPVSRRKETIKFRAEINGKKKGDYSKGQ